AAIGAVIRVRSRVFTGVSPISCGAARPVVRIARWNSSHGAESGPRTSATATVAHGPPGHEVDTGCRPPVRGCATACPQRSPEACPLLIGACGRPGVVIEHGYVAADVTRSANS